MVNYPITIILFLHSDIYHKAEKGTHLFLISALPEIQNRFLLAHILISLMRDEGAFVNALSLVTKDIYELCDAVAAKDKTEEEARLARGEIEHMSSLSAYLPDNMLHISLEV